MICPYCEKESLESKPCLCNDYENVDNYTDRSEEWLWSLYHCNYCGKIIQNWQIKIKQRFRFRIFHKPCFQEFKKNGFKKEYSEKQKVEKYW